MGRRGPKKGAIYQPTIDKAKAREALRVLVLKRMDRMVEAQMCAAEGLKVAVVRRSDGTFRRIDSVEALDAAIAAGDPMDIHTLQPSTQAFTDLMNRALDKPAEQEQQHQVTGTLKIQIDVPWLTK